MRAFEAEVVDVIWETIEPLIPDPPDTHPLGCHRPRISDRLCFWGILIRLVTGCSWVRTEKLLDYRVSDTTLRARRDEWIGAGVFDLLRGEAIAAYDRIIGLDLTEVSLDGCQLKAPCGGEGTGRNPVDRAKLGWKWSLAADRGGIPVGWVIDGANRSDLSLLTPTLIDVACTGLNLDVETLHLDKLYDFPKTRAEIAHLGYQDVVIQKRKRAVNPQPNSHSDWDSAGSWKAPTRGSPTTGNSAATPTARPGTDTPNSVWSPPSSSPSSSSIGETDGTRRKALSASALRFVEPTR